MSFSFSSKFSALALCAVLMSGSAAAAYELEKQTTLTDGSGGVMRSVSTGLVRQPGRDVSSTVEFTNFHPKTDSSLVLNGNIQRQQSGEKRDTLTLLNGQLSVRGVEGQNGEDVNLVFQDLEIQGHGRHREFEGTIVVNGETVDAANIPRSTARLLRKVMGALRSNMR